jgi:hypothetical protein
VVQDPADCCFHYSLPAPDSNQSDRLSGILIPGLCYYHLLPAQDSKRAGRALYVSVDEYPGSVLERLDYVRLAVK